MLPHFQRQLTEAQKHQLKIYERQERLDAFMRKNDSDYVETDPALKVQKPIAGFPIDMYEPIYKNKAGAGKYAK